MPSGSAVPGNPAEVLIEASRECDDAWWLDREASGASSGLLMGSVSNAVRAPLALPGARGSRRPLNARIFDRGERVERTRGWSHCWMNRTVGERIIASVDSV
jgi:hypothetical protein